MLLGYQNCSNVSDNNRNSQDQSLALNLPVFEPLFLNDLSLIHFNPDRCSNTVPSENDYFNPLVNLCSRSQTLCEEDHLIVQGFLKDFDKSICENSANLEEEVSKITFQTVESEDLLYKPDSGKSCSLALQQMLSFKYRLCVLARDGCQSLYLKKLGFLNDSLNICSAH